MTCGIYKLTSPSGKCYIGQSIDIERRINEHRCHGKYRSAKLCNAIRKYSFDNLKFEIIEECPPEKLNDREVYWISFYDSFNKGYNCTIGGENKYFRSEETKEKLRQKFLGVYNGTQNIEFTIDGIKYKSIGEASKKLNIPPKTIHNRLNSKNPKFSNYCYINDEKILKQRTVYKIGNKVYENLDDLCNDYNASTTTFYRHMSGIKTKAFRNIIVEVIKPQQSCQSLDDFDNQSK